MTPAFDTTDRNKLLDTYHKISQIDKKSMIQKFLSITTLSIKAIDYINEDCFNRNFWSLQSEEFSGINLNIYFEKALKEIWHKPKTFAASRKP